MSSSPADSAPRAWIVLPPEAPEIHIWGLTPEERLRRSLRNAGCARVERVAGEDVVPAPESGSALLLSGRRDLRPAVGRSPADRSRHAAVGAPRRSRRQRRTGRRPRRRRPLRGGARVAPRSRARAPGLPPGLRRVDARRSRARLHRVASQGRAPLRAGGSQPDEIPAIEKKLFGAAYKSITDLVTKWAWPVPAAAVTRVLARRGVHPNTVTIASWILAIAAALLFAGGRFGLGLVAAWAMTFLDTVDGKLARVTLTSSRFGHVLDHGLDLIHPPFWYLAWGFGAVRRTRRRDGRGRDRLPRRSAPRRSVPALLRDGDPLLEAHRLALPHDHRPPQSEPDPAHRQRTRGCAGSGHADGRDLDGRLHRLPRRPPAPGLRRAGARGGDRTVG